MKQKCYLCLLFICRSCLELQWYLQSLNIFWRWVYHLLCQCTKSEQSMQLIVFNITLVTFHLASVHSIRKQTKRNFMSSRSSFHPTGQNLFTAWVLLHLFQLTHMTGSSLSCLPPDMVQALLISSGQITTKAKKILRVFYSVRHLIHGSRAHKMLETINCEKADWCSQREIQEKPRAGGTLQRQTGSRHAKPQHSVVREAGACHMCWSFLKLEAKK